jgi:hypothetical protein
MKTGYLRQDESGHWYAVPTEHIVEFDKLSDEINSATSGSDEWYDLVDQFDDKFGTFRTGGGYSDFEIIIKEE